jgi:hypothetical protein
MIKLVENWKSEIHKERGLSGVFWASLGQVGKLSDLYFCAALCVVMHGALLFAVRYGDLPSGLSVAKWAQASAAILLGVIASILGFLIAGFSIFATMGKQNLFVRLAKFSQGARRLSEFKIIFFNFLYIFIHYISYCGVLTIFVLIFTDGPILDSIMTVSLRLHRPSVRLLMAEVQILFVCYTLYIFLLLKSFVWNLYQALLIVILEGGND